MNKANFNKEKTTRKAVLLIRVSHPKNFLKLDQTKQRLELACLRTGLVIIDVFYWYVDDSIRRDKIIATIKNITHKIILITNELDKENKRILDLDKFTDLKQQKFAKILLVDSENIIYQREEDL